MDEYLRDPASAALIAAGLTALYIHGKARLNDEGTLSTSAYAKPAALVLSSLNVIKELGCASLSPVELAKVLASNVFPSAWEGKPFVPVNEITPEHSQKVPPAGFS